MTKPLGNQTGAGASALRLRPETADDEAFLYTVYASTREEELDAADWDEATRQAFLRMQFSAQRRGYRDMFPEGGFLIILCGNDRAGRMVVNRTLDEIRLVDIALLPAFQNQGIGARLVGDLITEAKETGRPLRVSVFKPSRAAVFYQRLGFVKSGEAGLYDHWEWTATAPIKPVG